MNMSAADLILNFANDHGNFTLRELSGHVRSRENISDSGLLWHIKKLIKNNQLSRISRGLYGKLSKNEFMPVLTHELKQLHEEIKTAFPLVDVVVYSGNEINSLQHHLAPNNAIYVEVAKDVTEAVFHYLAEKRVKVYHKPSAELMKDYVDLSEKIVIVKALTSESPVMTVDGVMMPTLEKLLVDVNCDPDFFYLQGGETFYIMENAKSLYSINIPKMLRYASRRGQRKTMQKILNYND